MTTPSIACVKVKNIRPRYHNLKDWMEDPQNEYIGRAGIVFVKDEDGNKRRWPPRASKWANPFKVGKDGTLDEVLVKYEDHIRSRPDLIAALPELAGKNMGCWCKPNPTHAMVIP